MIKRILNSTDKKSLIIGLAAICALYGLIALYAAIAGKSKLAKMQLSAPSFSVSLQTQDDIDNNGHEKAPEQSEQKGKDNINDFYKESDDGFVLPVPRESDGKTPFGEFSQSSTNAVFGNKIAIIIADFGLSEQTSQKLLDTMAPSASVLLSPYSKDPQQWADKARAQGHEVWLYLPASSNEYSNDPRNQGPFTVTPQDGINKGITAFHRVLAKARGYAGIASPMDASFTMETPLWSAVFDDTFSRGLGFFQMHIGAVGSYDPILAVALKRGSPYVRANVLIAPKSLDELPSILENLEEIATSNGKAVAIIAPWPSLMPYVNKWAQGLEKNKNISLVSISTLGQTNDNKNTAQRQQKHH